MEPNIVQMTIELVSAHSHRGKARRDHLFILRKMILSIVPNINIKAPGFNASSFPSFIVEVTVHGSLLRLTLPDTTT
jgi:hypothetical protein